MFSVKFSKDEKVLLSINDVFTQELSKLARESHRKSKLREKALRDLKESIDEFKGSRITASDYFERVLIHANFYSRPSALLA